MTENSSNRWYSPRRNRSGKGLMAGLGYHVGWLIGVTTIVCPLMAEADGALELKPFSATFSVKRNLIPLGELALEFTLDEQGGYTYHAHTQPGMLAGWFSGAEIDEESRGQLSSDGIRPLHYTFRDLSEERESLVVKFDWHEGEVDTTSSAITWSQPITPGTQDRLSQQLLVRLHLAQDRRAMTYQVADGGKIKSYHFRVEGEEEIETPYGLIPCIRVKRSKEERKPDYTIWFAPQLDYLPVRIERQQSGRLYRMVLDELVQQETSE